MSIKPVKIPGVGMRNVKTALAAAFCALAYYFVGRSPAFACIGAIFGMGRIWRIPAGTAATACSAR